LQQQEQDFGTRKVRQRSPKSPKIFLVTFVLLFNFYKFTTQSLSSSFSAFLGGCGVDFLGVAFFEVDFLAPALAARFAGVFETFRRRFLGAGDFLALTGVL